MKTNLTIIVVHWNTPDKLKTSLDLLKKSEATQIVVVDNASTHELTWLKSAYPDVRLITNKFNRGYAFACNQGTVNAVGEWLLFLNPDVEISPGQIRELISFSQSKNLDACSITTNASYQKPLPTTFSLLSEFTPLKQILGINNASAKTLFGGCLLIKKSVLEKLGGWDERFFLWFEDSDLTKRLLSHGYSIGWTNLPIKHSGGESFKELTSEIKRGIFFNSMEIYASKHFTLPGRLIISLLKNRYTDRKLIPELQKITSITVPNLKKDLLKDFFKSNERFLSAAAKRSAIFEWIIVTSSMKENEVWEWRKKYPGIRFILLDKNAGFASSVNVGFRASSGNYAGTINDDVILTSKWLSPPTTGIDGPLGSLNPVVRKRSGEIESAGIRILKKGKALTIRSIDFSRNYIEVDATNAAAVIYSKEALGITGLFDERFGSYLEDIDLSLRLKKKGYKNFVSTESEVIHAGQSTSKGLHWRKQYLDFKNWILAILKNWSLQDLILNFPSLFIERLRNLSGVIKAIIN